MNQPEQGVRKPTAQEFRDIAARHGIILSEADSVDVEQIATGMLRGVDHLDELWRASFSRNQSERDPGRAPTREEDPYNAFIRVCDVQGTEAGKLAGKRVGVKDNVKVAGVPMTNGSVLHHDYVPDHDAALVERLLAEGATIVGKLNMDDFSWSGSGETSRFGPTLNPRNPRYSPGGSSSGSASAVASGHVDLAIGADQAGSIRIPAAWCGIVGIKATHGLVPTYGVAYMDHTIDCFGPMAQTVAEAALMLEVIAGPDPRDPQWVRGNVPTQSYSELLTKDVSSLKVGVVAEGFDWDFAEPDVLEATRAAITQLESLGATVREVSIPWWKESWTIQGTLLVHSASAMADAGGEGYWRGGLTDPSFMEVLGKALHDVPGSDLAPFFKVGYLVGQHLRQEYNSTYFGKAQNLRSVVRQQVDAAFEQVDVLVTPTVATKATPLSGGPVTLQALGNKGSANTHNTCIFNLTGHPALSVPCGVGADDLPIGLQIAGRHWEDLTIIQAAHALEQTLA